MNTRRLTLLCMTLLCSGLALNARAEQGVAAILKNKTIRIAVPADLPPFGFKGPDGKLRGLDIEMAELVASRLGVAAELVPVPSAGRVPALQERKVDLVISTLGRNADREKLIDFSDDYSSFYLSVFGNRAIAVSAPADLARKTIAVTRGSIEDQELTKVAPADARIQRFDDNAASLNAYISGTTQLLAAGMSVAAAAVQQNPALEAESKIVLKDSKNYIGIAKGEEELRTKVNEIVDEAKRSGALRKMSQKWFSRNGAK